MKKIAFFPHAVLRLARLLIFFPAPFFASPHAPAVSAASSSLIRNSVQEVIPAKTQSPSKAAGQVFKGAVLSSSLKTQRDFDGGPFKFKADGGLRLNFSGLSVFAGAGLPSWTFDEAGSCFDEGFSAVKSQSVTRWGLLAESPASFSVRARAMAGTVGFSHAISLLKSPLLPGGTSLRSPSLSKGDIGCSMPTVTSAKKEESVYASLECDAGRLSPKVCAMYSRDGSCALSAGFPLEFSKGCLLEADFAGGMFIHGSSYSSSWFCKNLPYAEEKYAACCSVVNLKLPFAKSSSVFGLCQNPSGGFYRWFRTVDGLDLASSLGLTSISGGFFSADGGLITASASRPDVNRQFFAGASHSFYTGKALLRSGGLFKRTLYAEGLPLERKKDLLRGDFSFSRGDAAFLASASGEFEDEKKASYKASCSLKNNFDALASSLTLSARHSGESDGLSLKLTARPKKLPGPLSLSLTAGVNANIIEERLSLEKLSASAAFSFKGKLMLVNAKFSFSSEIQ